MVTICLLFIIAVSTLVTKGVFMVQLIVEAVINIIAICVIRVIKLICTIQAIIV